MNLISCQEFPLFSWQNCAYWSLRCRIYLLLNVTHNSLVRSSLFDDIHGHDVVIARLMSCQTWTLEIICSMQKTLLWFRFTAIRIKTNFSLYLFFGRIIFQPFKLPQPFREKNLVSSLGYHPTDLRHFQVSSFEYRRYRINSFE